MNSGHTVLVSIDAAFLAKVSKAFVEQTSRTVLAAEVLSSAEVHVLITDDAAVRDLNRRFAGDDHATDVLSFSLREGAEFVAPDDVLRLGEVIVSYPTAERQGKEAGRSTEGEVAHLLTHGILHLLGYDHADPDDAQHMRAREAELLGEDVHESE